MAKDMLASATQPMVSQASQASATMLVANNKAAHRHHTSRHVHSGASKDHK